MFCCGFSFSLVCIVFIVCFSVSFVCIVFLLYFISFCFCFVLFCFWLGFIFLFVLKIQWLNVYLKHIQLMNLGLQGYMAAGMYGLQYASHICSYGKTV